MYKVRFNLGRGANYKKWQIRDDNNKPTYHNPSEVTLIMFDCKLHNNKKTAKNIFKGAHKTVCAWIECNIVDVVNKESLTDEKDQEIKYNPTTQPNWTLNETDVDGVKYDILHTNDVKIYILENKL